MGAVLGTSTTTTYVESSIGTRRRGPYRADQSDRGHPLRDRSFLSPIFLAIPSFATAPALVIVDFLMMQSVVHIEFTELTEGIPHSCASRIFDV